MSLNYWPALAALFAVCVAIPICLWCLKSVQRVHDTRASHLSIVQRLSLGPREHLSLVKCGPKLILIGVTAQSVQALGEFSPEQMQPQPSENQSPTQLTNASGLADTGQTFRSLLHKLRSS